MESNGIFLAILEEPVMLDIDTCNTVKSYQKDTNLFKQIPKSPQHIFHRPNRSNQYQHCYQCSCAG